jgi:hypothetical protein
MGLLKDLILRVLLLDFQGQPYLLDLSGIGFFTSREQGACELHGDGACSLLYLAGSKIRHKGTENSLDVNAVMLVEGAVLYGDYRIDEVFREFLEGYRVPFDRKELADQLAVSIVDFRRYFRFKVFQLRNIGDIIEGGNEYS